LKDGVIIETSGRLVEVMFDSGLMKQFQETDFRENH
jgi:hypothetical protein